MEKLRRVALRCAKFATTETRVEVVAAFGHFAPVESIGAEPQ